LRRSALRGGLSRRPREALRRPQVEQMRLEEEAQEPQKKRGAEVQGEDGKGLSSGAAGGWRNAPPLRTWRGPRLRELEGRPGEPCLEGALS